ncbi:hypothetical protein C5E04_09820 [Pectobacterium parmentieri]|nr:hypothetical protein C5E04_09820 [Pectobacterium parmentieri]
MVGAASAPGNYLSYQRKSVSNVNSLKPGYMSLSSVNRQTVQCAGNLATAFIPALNSIALTLAYAFLKKQYYISLWSSYVDCLARGDSIADIQRQLGVQMLLLNRWRDSFALAM